MSRWPIDARPSDAIALALRADCPIYVTEEVMQKAKLNTSGQAEGPTAEQLRGWLEGLNDEDLGRYKMRLSGKCAVAAAARSIEKPRLRSGESSVPRSSKAIWHRTRADLGACAIRGF
jgi:hypothetical protein